MCVKYRMICYMALGMKKLPQEKGTKDEEDDSQTTFISCSSILKVKSMVTLLNITDKGVILHRITPDLIRKSSFHFIPISQFPF